MSKKMRTFDSGTSSKADAAEMQPSDYAARRAASTCSLPSRAEEKGIEAFEDAQDVAIATRRLADRSAPNISWDDLKAEMEAEKKAA